jgi:molybdopterin/thiamine biosynthesis adenylyltransferase
MSQKPIVLNESVLRLIGEGYEVEVRHQHLLVSSIPYVTPAREIALGVLVCRYLDTDGVKSKPDDHTAWFKGDTPCNSLGQPLSWIINNSNPQTLFDQFAIQHYFSNKPDGVADFPADYFVKMTHYIDILVAQARAIEPNADARTGRVIESQAKDSIFRYPDTASVRAGIVAISQKLEMPRIGIVGLGGTGSYILDQVAKTPVKEIHLFDGDDFKSHNAFRSPGATSIETLQRQLNKADHFAEMYECMRMGVVSHPYYIDEGNIQDLACFDFVFVSVDDGPSRKLICEYLQNNGVPFIDVGMGLEKDNETNSLLGLCRVTMGTSKKNDHLASRLPTMDDKADALYRSNIQVADMNAINAILAVVKWKQYFGFYIDYELAHSLSFSASTLSVAREDQA